MKKLFVLLLLAMLLVVLKGQAEAQTPPSPPSSVVTEACRAAQLVGRTLPTSYTEAESQINPRTGHTLWKLKWVLEPPIVADVTVTVDQQSGKAIDYFDEAVAKECRESFESGQSVTVTATQAQVAMNGLMAGLPVTSGDWRVRDPQLVSSGGGNEQTGYPYWTVTARLYVDNRGVTLGNAVISMSPYNGAIYSWHINDNATFSPPTGSLLTVEQVESVAISAFTEYAASEIRVGDSTSPIYRSESAYWGWLSETSTLCRLMHTFRFLLPEIDDPDYDPTGDVEYQGRRKIIVQVDIDAETGEVLEAWCPFGSGSVSNPKGPKLSPRVQLMTALLHERTLSPLAFALAGGKPAAAIAPRPQAKRFTRQVGGKTVSFALNETAHRLTWETEHGKWSGVALTAKQTDGLLRLLASEK